ncbi:MAG: IclR family transcriptional regulator C-terminal domain-containing protein [Pseudomonadota bacterium]
MGTTDRSLSLLKLFTLERPAWTAEQAAAVLDVSMSTIYRYLLALEEIGLISATSPGRYVLGPAIIQLDRQIQLTDPLLIAARPVMHDLVAYAPPSSVVLLCRPFSDKVLCMHQVLSDGPAPSVSYDRGRPMPMFLGASSKIILAYLPPRHLKALYGENQEQARAAGLGDSWDAFRANMAALRKSGHAQSHGEVDLHRIGLSVAVLNEDRHAVGGLSYVVPDDTDQKLLPRLVSLLQTGAREVEAALGAEHGKLHSAQLDNAAPM